MQFTPEILRQHAQVLVDQEVKKNRDIKAAYLKGSLLYGSPLIGGAGDIDLVFVHNMPPIQERELRKLTPEIHFDIEHHDQLAYRIPRELRLDPWFGPTLRDAVPLYDPRHILDYTQSGVRSNFDFPENIHARSSQLISQARQFWMDRQIASPLEALEEVPAFLEALAKAANAVALLSGPPLATRRLGREFPDRADQAGAPGLGIAFSHLLGAVGLEKDLVSDWIGSWQEANHALQQQPDHLPILASQENYYLPAMEKMLSSSSVTAVLWPLLTTWTRMIKYLPEQDKLQLPWIKALTTLGFAGKDYLVRLAAFDSFLELCETLIEQETAASA